MQKKQIFHTVLTALFAALILVITRLSFPLAAGGYIHLGDAMIYLAALVLPLPYALSAAAIGAGLADFTSGYAIYVIPTILIKAALVLAAKGLIRLAKKPIAQDGLICATGVLTVAGYYLADVILTLLAGSSLSASFSASLGAIPFNTIQAVAAGALYLLLSTAARKAFKKH